MKRRTLLIGLGSIGTLAALVGWRLGISTQQNAIVAVLRKRLSYLRLDDTGVKQFAKDLAAKGQLSSLRLRLLPAAGPLYSDLALSGHSPLENGIRHGEERVVTIFLLSSDFFKSGMDETRVIQYLGYYDPLQACGNPFARRPLLS